MSVDMKFCAIIVNYNGALDTVRCVQSLMESAEVANCALKILIIDNTSDEFSFPAESVRVIRTGHNVGLSGAWYIGTYNEWAQKSDYIIYINNDAVSDPNFFREITAGIEKWGPGCAFSPRISRTDRPDVIWSRGGRIKKFSVSVLHFGEGVRASEVETKDFETGHLSGCCIIISPDHMNRIGGPDTNFFFRGEEWDINYRLADRGVRLVVLDSAIVLHSVNGSHDRFSPKMLYFAYRAKVLFAKKILPAWYFPVWYGVAYAYSVAMAPAKFSKLSGRRAPEIRAALRKAFLDGATNNKISPHHYEQETF